jgi:hypothetical protein
VIEDFRDFLRALTGAEVRFLVVGAHALSIHGVPRATGDLDVWVDRNAENAKRIMNALIGFGAPVADLEIREADFTRPDVVAQLGLPPYRIDLLTSISGVDFEDAWHDRVPGEIEGETVSFAHSFKTNGRPVVPRMLRISNHWERRDARKASYVSS